MGKRHFALLVLSALFLITTSAFAEDYYWVGDSGGWEDPNNWSLTEGGPGGAGPPIGRTVDTSNVFITQYNSNDINITINSDVDISRLNVNTTGSGIISINQTDSSFYSPYRAMLEGNSIVTQNGGYAYSHSGYTIDGIYNLYGDGTGGINSGFNGGSRMELNGIYNNYSGHISADAFYVNSNGTYNSYSGYFGGTVTYNYGTVNLFGGPTDYSAQTNYSGQNGFGHTLNYGTYNDYSGGLLMDLHNSGTFNMYGNNDVEIRGSSANTGVLNIYGTGNRNINIQDYTFVNQGTIDINERGIKTITGNILNEGTVKTTNTIVYYNGTFTNNGAYISDPSTQYFTDLIVGQNGYLVGQLADAFKISGNLISSSIMNNDWNTKHSYLQFITGSSNSHDYYLTGANYGAGMPGYANNFAWGTLDVTGNIVHFYDGNSDAGAALYLRDIVGLEITEQLIANLFGFDGLNIYYMANLPWNEYLHGLDYALAGGGHLTAVPEPSTMLLLGSGLVGLVGCGRRRMFLK